ncbi:binding--dependent transport system inner membrane component family protein [Paraburkholderia xenovorans LB400]|uniref:ABC nickel transporter, inner membrane subunit n=1 Tax=Paraburkholderia xenovorans (strain LB400) TaxID=266265 RepID=Q13J76_PARXL|nr:ABC transporter permease [Paraburkholderia xenovorans]ABE35863.1 ABC nickel transporter, inner membrane subunit [Paraburkholderia xenovorans LB400]AIP37504.1 binding--dependent transport system inner membrane component family protein [Paraburkholderia xenovorans LB400]
MISRFRTRFGGISPYALIPVLLFILVALFAPVLARYAPDSQVITDAMQGPSPAHWLGTDYLGRDVLSRLIWAARVSLVAMSIVLISALVIGILVGSIAGYIGGKVDLLLIGMIDIMLSLPSLIIALALIGIIGPGYWSMIAALTLAWWANYARMSRAVVAGEVHQPHIEACRIVGASHWWIFTRHILPSVLGVVLVYASADAGALVLSIATLSFLGLGVVPPTPEWGQMVVDGMNYLEDSPGMVVLPGLALTLVVISFNVLGEAIALQKLPRAVKGRAMTKRMRARALEEQATKRSAH